MKKIISILAALSVAVSAFSVMTVNVNARAADTGAGAAQPYYLYGDSATSKISASGSTVTCTSTARGKSGVTKITATQYLEINGNSSYWGIVDSWSKTSNSRTLSMTNSKSGRPSGTYRTRTVFTFYKNGNPETVTLYSSNLKI